MKHHILRRHLCFVLLCLCTLAAMPLGRIVARNVRFLPNDMAGPMSHVKDNMGRDTYLLKVKLPYPGAIFDGMVKSEYLASEYHVWMEGGNKLLDVRFPGCESALINLQELLGEPLVAPRTYELTLDLDALEYRASDLTATPLESSISIESEPSSSRVRVDGKDVGVTPMVIGDLQTGHHKIEIIKEGYQSWAKEVDLKGGDNHNFIVNLTAYANAPANKTKNDNADGYINGYGYVDLGLPSGTKWATCNVGATSPSNYGNYFAWGEISKKSTYTEHNSTTYGKDGISDISGDPSMDAARAQWGSTWRLPTKAELEELRDKCSWTWTKQGGHNGYKITGPNGHSIFLPAAGWRHGSPLYYQKERCYYWSSSPCGSVGAYRLLFSRSGYHNVERNSRLYGLSIRPVSE